MSTDRREYGGRIRANDRRPRRRQLTRRVNRPKPDVTRDTVTDESARLGSTMLVLHALSFSLPLSTPLSALAPSSFLSPPLSRLLSRILLAYRFRRLLHRAACTREKGAAAGIESPRSRLGFRRERTTKSATRRKLRDVQPAKMLREQKVHDRDIAGTPGGRGEPHYGTTRESHGTYRT